MAHQTQLCLACSASLPPNLFKQALSPSTTSNSTQSGPVSPGVFLTPCCSRPICPTCTTRNPRLTRYNPCLVCVRGIGVLEASGSSTSSGLAKKLPRNGISNAKPGLNMNGEVRDEDTFVVGDDDEEGMLYDDDGDEEVDARRDEEELEQENYRRGGDLHSADGDPRSPSPSHSTTASTAIDSLSTLTLTNESPSQEETPNDDPSRPYNYFLNRSDTLQGISLRFGVPVHEICKLNSLPLSILRSPHLLHTRSSILLPASASLKPHPSLVRLTSQESQNLEASDEITKARDQRRAKERAEKKLQLVTKEVDWRVARVYVALADDLSTQDDEYGKEAYGKELGGGKKLNLKDSDSTEYLAIERYLDDMEWEEGERKAGRDAKLQKFPYADFGEASSSSNAGKLRRKEFSDPQKGESTVLWSPTRADDLDSSSAESIRGLGVGLAKGVGVGVGVMGGWFKNF